MSLYLAGRTKENYLVFASDGREVSLPTNKIINDSSRKVKALKHDLVLCLTGNSLLGELTCRIMSKVYDNFAKYDAHNAARNTVTCLGNEYHREQLEDTLEGMYKQLGIHTGNSFSTTSHIFTTDGQTATTSLIMISNNPHFRYTTYEDADKNFSFPFRYGGVTDLAAKIIGKVDDKPMTINETLGLFAYILQEVSEEEEGVGGEMYFSLMNNRDYREMSDKELLDIFEIAETFRKTLSAK